MNKQINKWFKYSISIKYNMKNHLGCYTTSTQLLGIACVFLTRIFSTVQT